MTGRPPCDCGHAFERDPRWFHLGGCAYRESFRLSDGTIYRFTTVPAHRVINLTPRDWAVAVRRAEARAAIRRRRASRIPTIRAAYARTRRARRRT